MRRERRGPPYIYMLGWAVHTEYKAFRLIPPSCLHLSLSLCLCLSLSVCLSLSLPPLPLLSYLQEHLLQSKVVERFKAPHGPRTNHRILELIS